MKLLKKLWKRCTNSTPPLVYQYYETDYVSLNKPTPYGIYVYKTNSISNKKLVRAEWFKSIHSRNLFIANGNLKPLIHTCGCTGVTLFDAVITIDSLDSAKHWSICKNCLKEKINAGALAIL